MPLEIVEFMVIAADQHFVAGGSCHRLRGGDDVTDDGIVGAVGKDFVHEILVFEQDVFIQGFPYAPVGLRGQVCFREVDVPVFQATLVPVECAESGISFELRMHLDSRVLLDNVQKGGKEREFPS